MRTRRSIFACALGGTALAAPAVQAATYHVQAGESSRRGAPPAAIQTRFMPGTVHVHAGDTVEWMGGVTAPHTVTFLKGRAFADNAFVIPDPSGGVYAEALDAAGAAFAYSGRPRLTYNAAILPPTGGASISGGRLQSTGLFGPEFGRATARFRFPKAGVYRYNCLLHPGMKGTIAVEPKGASIPTPETVLRRAARIQAAGWRTAARLLTAELPANTVLDAPAAVDASGDVNLFLLRPARLTVRAGTTVTFRNDSATEAHNVGFGPRAYIRAKLKAEDQFPDRPTDPNQLAGFVVHGTEAAPYGSGQPFPYVPTAHGNGFASFPGIDGSRLTPFGRTTRVTFPTPGRYMVYCLLHFPDMTSTITVTP